MTNPVNLLFVSTYVGMGGGETIQLNLMRALDRERYHFRLLNSKPGAFPDAAAQANIPTHVIPYRGTTTVFIPGLWRRTSLVAKLRTFLRDHGINLLVTDYHSLPFIVPAAESMGIPVVWLSQGWWFPVYPWQREFFRNHIAHTVTISATIKQRWLERYDAMSPERITPIIPGVDPSVYRPDIDGAPVRDKLGIGPDVPLVALVARFQDVKGHEYFLEAARHILSEAPNTRFVVAGENVFAVSKDEAYKQRILRMRENDPLLREHVTYLGFWPGALEVYAAANVIVCSSLFESLGMVALESMAMQRPIVNTNVGGPSETILDGVTGYLVPPRDSRAIARRVVSLLRDPALRQSMGKAGREHVIQHYTSARYAASFSTILERLIGKQ
jgi:glycosyltransferase involved in cell wall biosynthesis